MIFINTQNVHSIIDTTLTQSQKNRRTLALNSLINSATLGVPLNIQSAHYKHPVIKQSYLLCQNNKCAYCESVITIVPNNPQQSNNSIEHFRPKGSYIQKYGRKEYHPGYYWLAYDLSNIFIACKKCNNLKANFFPILLHTTRCTTHMGNLDKEEELIVNPFTVDPKEHIVFNKYIIKSKTYKGKTTIKYLGLNRQPLIELRKDVYDALALLKQFIEDDPLAHDNYNNRLSEAELGITQYSKMILDNFRD